MLVAVNRGVLAAAAVVVAAGSMYVFFGLGRKKNRVNFVMGKVNYQTNDVPTSLRSSGKVYVDRQTTGADKPPVGEKQRAVSVPVRDARGMNLTIDANGVKLVEHVIRHGDYEDVQHVVKDYYPECCKLVKEYTGATKVLAFDHNLRGSAVQSWMNKDSDDKQHQTLSPQYQSPAAIVHGDYTITSAPLRLRMLSQPPKVNDTWKCLTDGNPLIEPEEVEQRLKSRYMFINVWRNIADEPVEDMPLGVVDATSLLLIFIFLCA